MFGYKIKLAKDGRFFLHHATNAVPIKTLKRAYEIAVYWHNAGIPKGQANG